MKSQQLKKKLRKDAISTAQQDAPTTNDSPKDEANTLVNPEIMYSSEEWHQGWLNSFEVDSY